MNDLLRNCTKNILEEFPDIRLPLLYCELFRFHVDAYENGDSPPLQESSSRDVARESAYHNMQRVPTPSVQPSDWPYKLEVYNALEELSGFDIDTNGDRETPTRAFFEGGATNHDRAGFNGNGRNDSGSSASSGNGGNMLMTESSNGLSGEQIAQFDEDLSIAFASISRGAEFEGLYRDSDHHFNPTQSNQSVQPVQMYTANVHSITPLPGPSHSNHTPRHDPQIVKMENSAHSPMDLSQLNDGRNGSAP